jgi:hypothetical protein
MAPTGTAVADRPPASRRSVLAKRPLGCPTPPEASFGITRATGVGPAPRRTDLTAANCARREDCSKSRPKRRPPIQRSPPRGQPAISLYKQGPTHCPTAPEPPIGTARTTNCRAGAGTYRPHHHQPRTARGLQQIPPKTAPTATAVAAPRPASHKSVQTGADPLPDGPRTPNRDYPHDKLPGRRLDELTSWPALSGHQPPAASRQPPAQPPPLSRFRSQRGVQVSPEVLDVLDADRQA